MHHHQHQQQEGVEDDDTPFQNIVVEEVLSYRSHSKTISLRCIWDDQPAIVTLERLFLSDVNPYGDMGAVSSALRQLKRLSSGADSMSDFRNDIYGSMIATLPQEQYNAFKVMTVCPATDEMMDKFRHRGLVAVRETAAVYESDILAYIRTQPPVDWIENILNRESEVERIIFADDDPGSGFVLLPDFKWDGSLASLYCLAICQTREIRSIRDLRDEHLPLLENIRNKSSEAIRKRWGIDDNQLRFYVHYHPSFYHFHVHITHVHREAVNIEADRAHMLDSVIDNIRTWPDFYARATLCYRLVENHPIRKILNNDAE